MPNISLSEKMVKQTADGYRPDLPYSRYPADSSIKKTRKLKNAESIPYISYASKGQIILQSLKDNLTKLLFS